MVLELEEDGHYLRLLKYCDGELALTEVTNNIYETLACEIGSVCKETFLRKDDLKKFCEIFKVKLLSKCKLHHDYSKSETSLELSHDDELSKILDKY